MPAPKLCAAGVTLRNQVNRKWPKRDKTSDGWIGNRAHQETKSDHNPDMAAGAIVRAIDIDADLDVTTGDHSVAVALAEELRNHAKQLRATNRISYIIFQKRIASDKGDWSWRPYLGQSPHMHHIHISFKSNGDADGKTFELPILKIKTSSK
jgi:hypothetical protein